LYCGDAMGGVSYFRLKNSKSQLISRKNQNWQTQRLHLKNPVNCMLPSIKAEGQSVLWVASYDTINILSLETFSKLSSFKVREAHLITRMIAVNSEIWISSAGSIFIYNGGTAKLLKNINMCARDDYITSITPVYSPRGKLCVWVGLFSKKIVILNSKGATITEVANAHDDKIDIMTSMLDKIGIVATGCSGGLDNVIKMWMYYWKE